MEQQTGKCTVSVCRDEHVYVPALIPQRSVCRRDCCVNCSADKSFFLTSENLKKQEQTHDFSLCMQC